MTVNGDALQVIAPRAKGSKRAYVDFVFALDYLSVNSGLLRIMQDAMADYGLSCLLINQTSVERSLHAVRRGTLRPIVFLDLCSRPGDVFTDLLRTMGGAGVTTLCDPKTLKWTFKAVSHPALEAAGLPLPPSVILKKSDPDRELTADERARVGDRSVIKPSYGVAGLGAVIGVPPTRDEIAKARAYNRDDDWLIQRMIKWGAYGERQSYLRGYNVLGHRTLMWWSGTKGYQSLTWSEFHKYNLGQAVELVDRVAAVTGVEFFSSEIAIDEEQRNGTGRFCLIDYVNDQCDLDPDIDPNRSPPLEWVKWVCHRMAEFTWRKKHGVETGGAGTLYLAEG